MANRLGLIAALLILIPVGVNAQSSIVNRHNRQLDGLLASDCNKNAGPCDLRAGTTIGGAAPGGGVSDGDKGDITVSGSGATWSVDTSAIDFSELAGSATDGQIPDSITITLSGTATALAANPADCLANQFATTIAASGALTCAAIADADVPNTITVDLATLATTATTANAGDSATAFFSSGEIADAQVSDAITASNYLPLAGGTLTGNLVLSADANEGVSGGGLSDCDNATTSKLLWDTTTNKFSCGTDQGGGGGVSDGDKGDITVSASGATWTIDDTITVSEWTIDGLNMSAGSASAGTWPTIASGTVLTTAEDNAIENDGNTFYATTDAGNRGYVPARNCIRANATRTLTSSGSEQALFNSPTNGRLTLETGTYLFEGMFYLSGMSGTSGNAAIDPLGAGTATATAWLWQVRGLDNTTVATVGAPAGQAVITQQTAASAVTAGTGTAMTAFFNGTFEITDAGTFIPSVTLVTAATPTVNLGSYICVERIGSDAAVSIGQWD